MRSDRLRLAGRAGALAMAVLISTIGGSDAHAAGQRDESLFDRPEKPFLSAQIDEIASLLQSLGGITSKQTGRRERDSTVRPRFSPADRLDVNSISAAAETRSDSPSGGAELAVFQPEERFTFADDARRFLPTLRDDARGIVNWNNAAILGVALGTAIAFRQGLDADVRANTARHPERWDEGSAALGFLGRASFQIPVLAVVYGVSLHRQDEELHDFSTTLVSAYTINGLSTLVVKAVANTDRPSDDWNGGQFGFPSFHASSSFTIAAVVEEYYGPEVGLPAYALAGLISWSRIDERDHDLSDVVFGAAMGYVIGKSVAGRHLRGDSRVRLLPYVHPGEGTSGLMVDVAF